MPTETVNRVYMVETIDRGRPGEQKHREGRRHAARSGTAVPPGARHLLHLCASAPQLSSNAWVGAGATDRQNVQKKVKNFGKPLHKTPAESARRRRGALLGADAARGTPRLGAARYVDTEVFYAQGCRDLVLPPARPKAALDR